MPEPITITQPETPALSEDNIKMLAEMDGEQPQEESGDLLAGKYKSVEDLEKAYKELQSKLGQPREEVDSDDEEIEPEVEEQEEQPPVQSAREIYGDVVGSKLEEAGVDYQSMSDRWAQNGQLGDEDYSQLQEAGFSREMVDAYLQGLNYQATKDNQLAAQEVAAIRQEYGGDAQYTAMIEWAAGNLSKAEVDAFNQVVNTQPLDVVKLAVAGLHAKYTGAVGREPRLVSGRAPKQAGDKFESTAQVVEAMKDPRYESDPAYRRKVEQKLARSSIL